ALLLSTIDSKKLDKSFTSLSVNCWALSTIRMMSAGNSGTSPKNWPNDMSNASQMIFNLSREGAVLPVSMSLRYVCEIRSEEHTSELQSRFDLVCRLLLEKKK